MVCWVFVMVVSYEGVLLDEFLPDCRNVARLVNGVSQCVMPHAIKWHVFLWVETDNAAHFNNRSYITVIPPLPWRNMSGNRVTIAKNYTIEGSAIPPNLQMFGIAIL